MRSVASKKPDRVEVLGSDKDVFEEQKCSEHDRRTSFTNWKIRPSSKTSFQAKLLAFAIPFQLIMSCLVYFNYSNPVAVIYPRLRSQIFTVSRWVRFLNRQITYYPIFVPPDVILSLFILCLLKHIEYLCLALTTVTIYDDWKPI